MTAPLHNSIAPYVKLRDAGVRCYLGVDNVHDLFMPMVDGDIWTEARMLMESTRFYDIDAVAEWACMKPVTANAELKASKPRSEAKAVPAENSDSADAALLKKRAAGGRSGR